MVTRPSELWQRYIDSGTAACREKRYSDAEQFFRQALQEARATGISQDCLALSVNNLAWVLQRLGKFDQAEPLYESALELVEQICGPEHPDVATVLHNMSRMYVACNRGDKAQQLLRRALDIRRKAFGPDNSEVLATHEEFRRLLRDNEARMTATGQRIPSLAKANEARNQTKTETPEERAPGKFGHIPHPAKWATGPLMSAAFWAPGSDKEPVLPKNKQGVKPGASAADNTSLSDIAKARLAEQPDAAEHKAQEQPKETESGTEATIAPPQTKPIFEDASNGEEPEEEKRGAKGNYPRLDGAQGNYPRLEEEKRKPTADEIEEAAHEAALQRSQSSSPDSAAEPEVVPLTPAMQPAEDTQQIDQRETIAAPVPQQFDQRETIAAPIPQQFAQQPPPMPPQQPVMHQGQPPQIQHRPMPPHPSEVNQTRQDEAAQSSIPPIPGPQGFQIGQAAVPPMPSSMQSRPPELQPQPVPLSEIMQKVQMQGQPSNAPPPFGPTQPDPPLPEVNPSPFSAPQEQVQQPEPQQLEQPAQITVAEPAQGVEQAQQVAPQEQQIQIQLAQPTPSFPMSEPPISGQPSFRASPPLHEPISTWEEPASEPEPPPAPPEFKLPEPALIHSPANEQRPAPPPVATSEAPQQAAVHSPAATQTPPTPEPAKPPEDQSDSNNPFAPKSQPQTNSSPWTFKESPQPPVNSSPFNPAASSSAWGDNLSREQPSQVQSQPQTAQPVEALQSAPLAANQIAPSGFGSMIPPSQIGAKEDFPGLPSQSPPASSAETSEPAAQEEKQHPRRRIPRSFEAEDSGAYSVKAVADGLPSAASRGITLTASNLVHPSEGPYSILSALLSIGIYIAAAVSIVGLPVLAALFLIAAIGNGIFVGCVRSNGIKVERDQFPDIYENAAMLSKKMDINLPDIYVLNGADMMNTFALRCLSRDFVVINASVVEVASEQGENELAFVVAHELAHIERRHFKRSFLHWPASCIPLCGQAYARAKELTCDRYAKFYCPEGAKYGLVALAAGSKLYKQVNLQALYKQASQEKGFCTAIYQSVSSQPTLVRRIQELGLD